MPRFEFVSWQNLFLIKIVILWISARTYKSQPTFPCLICLQPSALHETMASFRSRLALAYLIGVTVAKANWLMSTVLHTWSFYLFVLQVFCQHAADRSTRVCRIVSGNHHNVRLPLWLVTIMSNSNFFLNVLPCYLLLCIAIWGRTWLTTLAIDSFPHWTFQTFSFCKFLYM